MTQDQDVFRTTGRGGAGNYISAKQANTASPAQQSDKPQNGQEELSTSVAAPPSTTSSHPARAGRGGAGNYVDPGALPDAEEQERQAAAVSAAVDSSLRQREFAGRGGGRGGAGNWEAETGARAQDEEQGLKGATQELERKVKEAVDKSLKMPEKAHRGREKEGEAHE